MEVVEADGDAVPENEGATVLLFVEAEALSEILVGLEAAAQLHGCPLSPRQGRVLRAIPGVRGHTRRVYRLPSVRKAFELGPNWWPAMTLRGPRSEAVKEAGVVFAL